MAVWVRPPECGLALRSAGRHFPPLVDPAWLASLRARWVIRPSAPRLWRGWQRASGSTSSDRPVFLAASRPHARGESEGWVGCPPSAVPSPRAGKGRGPVAAPLMVALMSYRRSTPTSRVGLMAVWVRPPSAAPGEGRGRRPVAVPLRATLSFEEGEMKNLPLKVALYSPLLAPTCVARLVGVGLRLSAPRLWRGWQRASGSTS